ncbi:MAG: roadblock/LC7 domain-containing protein [Promethearchaeota archaeon]
MNLKDQISKHLTLIKNVKGVENVVLTQRDGNPLQSVGVWLSKNEIFNLTSATSAIYNLGMHLHSNNLKYILLEGKVAKILIAPLKNSMEDPLDRIMIRQGIQNKNEEFFIAISALPSVNLGSVFLQTKQCLREIKRDLILSGESFKPPLRTYNEEELKKVLASFNIKEDSDDSSKLDLYSFAFSSETLIKIENVLKKIAENVLDLNNVFITLSGGFLISKLEKNNDLNVPLEHYATMSYSLYSTSNRCAWLLKKMKINSILLECDSYFQFISELCDGIFSLKVSKGRQKLGLLRLLLPRYLKYLSMIIKEAKTMNSSINMMEIKNMIGQIYLK